MNNSFGDSFRLTTFGESHGEFIGGIIDGCPSSISIDLNLIKVDLDRRRPGQSSLTTQRKESDHVEFLSGIFNGKTTGAPIAFMIKNENTKSSDYDGTIFRPSHADYTYRLKYENPDWRGGGRSSARETACRVVAGSIAKQLLSNIGISIHAWVSQIGSIKMDSTLPIILPYKENSVRCPDKAASELMIEEIKKVKKLGDSVGGIITCKIINMKRGIGDPIFNKLQSKLAYAMLSIPAVKGFDYGSGFDSVNFYGSKLNDSFYKDYDYDTVRTWTNNSGGIQGGISNGEDIIFRVAFKPTASISKEQNTIDIYGNDIKLKTKGRHDPCVVPRAVPIVESMAALTLINYNIL